MTERNRIVIEVLSTLHVAIKDFEEYSVMYHSDKPLRQEESYVGFRAVDGGYEVYSSNRNNIQVIATELSEEQAIIWAALAFIRHHIIDFKKSNTIRRFMLDGEKNEAMKLVDEISNYYSEEDNDDCLILKRKHDENEIRYKTFLIAGGLSDDNVYPVLYNFASLLRFIREFCERYGSVFDEEEIEELILFFLTNRKHEPCGVTKKQSY